MISPLRVLRRLARVGCDFGASGLLRYARKSAVERLPLHPDHVPFGPGHLQIEISGKCNLECPFCPRTFTRSGWRNLPFDEYRRIVESAPGLWSVNLQGFGEPLLHPELEAIVRWTRARGIEVGFATNATLLDERRGRALIAAGLDWLNVSMDGATPATYERLRVGASFEKVLANTERFVALAAAAGRPVFTLVYVCVHSNVGEIPLFLDLAARIGARRVFLAPVLDLTQEVPAERLEAADRARVLEAAAAGRARGLEVQVGVWGDRVRPGELPCDWPWNKSYVTAEGRVTPCCIEPETAIGDALRDGIEAVWHGEEYVRLRRGLNAGSPHPICRKNCFRYGP